MSEENFEAVSKVLAEDREKHEKQLKAFCVTTEVCSFQEFLSGYEEEAKVIDASDGDTDTTLIPCSIACFKEIFQAFEKYPSNLQKPKKQVSKDLNRSVASNRSQSSSSIDLVPNAEKWDKGPDAATNYKNYRKSMKMIKQLQELSKDALELKYVESLHKIHNLAKSIEKLQDDQLQNAELAFNSNDAGMLERFIENFEKALYVDKNQNLFKDYFENEQYSENVSNIIELLDYYFEKIGHFREN